MVGIVFILVCYVSEIFNSNITSSVSLSPIVAALSNMMRIADGYYACNS
jgi:hypothetical protein